MNTCVDSVLISILPLDDLIEYEQCDHVGFEDFNGLWSICQFFHDLDNVLRMHNCCQIRLVARRRRISKGEMIIMHMIIIIMWKVHVCVFAAFWASNHIHFQLESFNFARNDLQVLPWSDYKECKNALILHTDGNALHVRWFSSPSLWSGHGAVNQSVPYPTSEVNWTAYRIHTTHGALVVSFSEIDFVPFYHFHFCRAVSCLFIIHSVVLLFARSLFWRAIQYTKYALDTYTHSHQQH